MLRICNLADAGEAEETNVYLVRQPLPQDILLRANIYIYIYVYVIIYIYIFDCIEKT
jgi:hypothetical protein